MKTCRKGFSTEPSDREKMMRGRVSCVAPAYLVRVPRTKPHFAWYRQLTLCSFSTSAQPDPGLSPEEMFLPLERKRRLGQRPRCNRLRPTSTLIQTHKIQKTFTQGTILHETLHNITGMFDHQLELLLGLTTAECNGGSTCISRILVKNGCAPK
jgi:hypothetical protein